MLEYVKIACPACGQPVAARRLVELDQVVVLSHEHPSGGRCHAGGETIALELVAIKEELGSPHDRVEDEVEDELEPARWWIWRGFAWLAAVLIGIGLSAGEGDQAGALAVSFSAVVAIGVLEAGRAWPSLVVRITRSLESDDEDGSGDGGG